MKYDYLIVGAGFAGCVLAERLATQLDKKILVVEKRNHIGGNAYDYYNEDGLLIHKYGPHWFHTNSKYVFDYLSQFTAWHKHEHRVRSCVEGQLYPIPINMDTINQLYGLNLTRPEEVEAYLNSVREPIDHPSNAEELVLSRVGKDLYEKFFKGYTLNQWGIHPRNLAASVTARIPVRFNRDDRYFTDIYQGLPRHSYTKLFENMLNHKNITVVLNTDYRAVQNDIRFNQMIYTGPIDEFFDSRFGMLPYRSIRFEHQPIDREYFQTFQQINYPNNFDFTRIVEVKHASGQKHPRTVITREYSCDPAENNNEKYYPIPNEANRELYRQYKAEAQKLKNVIFCGRLAEYQYYNMDQVVARALHVFEKHLTK
ncbi:MAG: UDP-galactopyranose mutase [Calditrichia bacterium]